MACNVASILAGDIKSLKVKGSEDVDDGILSNIKKYTYELSQTDCPNVVYDYFNKLSNGDLDASNKKITEYMDIGQWMTKLSNYVKDTTGNDGSQDIINTLCITINGIYKTLVDIIEKAVSVVPEMFKKLDQLRKEIEQIILNFGLEIKNCVLSVITAVQDKLNALTKGMTIDFSKLIQFMEACPCAATAIGALFGCTNKSSPAAIAACIKESFDITPTGVMTAINKFFNNTLKATVAAVYAAFESALKYVFMKVMKPIRELVKKYCELLNYKWDISFIVDKLGPADCFVVHSTETKVTGNIPRSYSGMSILDFIRTLKMWATCFDTICSFSSDIALKIKSYNEKLRLAPRFWIDTYTIDIFTACIAPSAGVVVNDADVREVFVKNQDSSKNSMVDLYDAVKRAKAKSIVVFIPYDEYGDTMGQVISPDPESGTGVGITKGDSVLYDGIDDRVMQITNNIASGLSETDSYYRIYQTMKMWLGKFNKSSKLLDAMSRLENAHSMTGTIALASESGVGISTASAEPTITYDPFNPDLKPTYKQTVSNEVNQFPIKPEQISGQSLVNYYKSWYELNK